MNVIVIHGGPLLETPENPHRLHELYWQPWAKNELENQGITCSVPAMPNPWLPEYKEWKEEFEKLQMDESTVLVGHSRGVAFLLRWLSETELQVGKLIMVAPNLRTESVNPVLQDFYSFDIDEGIQKRVGQRIIFTSENDDLENIESAELLTKKLDCKVINLPDHGHFITQDMGGNEFHELVEEIVKD
jgi:predicted alpha/beta hydrolase family esterase